jgi:hypothetical protein
VSRIFGHMQLNLQLCYVSSMLALDSPMSILRPNMDVGKKSDSFGCVREQRKAEGYMAKRAEIAPTATTYRTRANIKIILPMVFRPVKRCGVVARRMATAAVDSGRVNQAQVKLLADSLSIDISRASDTHCSRRSLRDTLVSELVRATSLTSSILPLNGYSSTASPITTRN